MPLAPAPPAPYDSLETVTQLTRTVLGDYVANINPSPQGTCNTNGIAFTWVSGPQLSIYFNGVQIQIGNQNYQIQRVTGPTTAILASSAGVQNGVNWTAVIPTGDVFADSQAYVVATVNLAWRKLQKKLADKGHPRLKNLTDIFGIPLVTNLDPISQQAISWTGFFDGTNQQNSPALPADFISPLRIWERPNGASPNLNRLCPMHPAPDGLTPRVKNSWNRYWDWREDAIYVRGAIILTDWQLQYAAYLSDIVPAAGGFAATPVPIMRCAEALAKYTAAEFVGPRGGVMGVQWQAEGDMAVDQITNSFAKLQQRSSYSRRAWGMRFRRGIAL